MSAAGKVSSLAVGDPDVSPAAEVFTIPQDASQDRHVEGLPLGTIGGILATPTIQIAGEYELSSKFFRTNLGVIRGLEDQHVLEVRGGRRTCPSHQTRWTGGLGRESRKQHAHRLIKSRSGPRFACLLTPGPHEITAAWIKKSDAIDPVRTTRPIRSSHDTRDPLGIPHLSTFTITGPFKSTGPGDMPSRRRIFTCTPAAGRRRTVRQADHRDHRASRLSRTGDRCRHRTADGVLPRRPSAARLRPRHPGRAAAGARQPEVRVPRRTRTRPAFQRGRVYRLSDLELASRLSFFLWSSIPDDELLDVAAQSRLQEPAVLERQVRRMLADPKSRALRRPTSPASGCICGTSRTISRIRSCSRFRRQPASGVPARGGAVLREHRPRGPQRARPDDRRLHVRQRAARQALRHSERLRKPVPPRDADRRRAQGAARQGRDPDGDVARRRGPRRSCAANGFWTTS